MTRRLVVRARRAALPAGIAPAALFVEEGTIRAVEPLDAPLARHGFAGATELDVGSATLLPGLVDSHVHANEPGRTDWEGLETATRAAAAGGVTTIVDMPLNSLPPTTSVAALEEKRAAARDRVWTDVAFWGGAVPGNEADLGPLHAAGVCGVKGFLADSGVPEFPPLAEADLAGAMAECARVGVTLLVHAELPGRLAAAPRGRSYAGWLASRPPGAEVEAIALLVRVAQRLGASGMVPRVHVVHLSAAEALPLLAGAQAEGLALSAETCPHYLALVAEEIEDGATLCKCAPPIRDAANRERLWQGLAAGTIALVASDHSPSPPAGKALDDGDFGRAWGGISSLGLGLPVLWTEASRRGHDLAAVARWMASGPARLAGLGARKGALAAGKDADFVLFDAEAAWTIDPGKLWTRHRITPYAGRAVRGRVRATYLRGERVYAGPAAGAAGGAFAGAPRGRLLARGEEAA
jgi:allantoinase